MVEIVVYKAILVCEFLATAIPALASNPLHTRALILWDIARVTLFQVFAGADLKNPYWIHIPLLSSWQILK